MEAALGILGEYLSAREMAAVELNAQWLGVSTTVMMENAGRAVAWEVAKRFPRGSRVVVLAGTSGNGGDALVAARHLAGLGFQVEALLVGDPRGITREDTLGNLEAVQAMEATVELRVVRDGSQAPELDCDVVVDGLLGINLRGPLRPPHRQVVEAVNRSKAFVVSVDLPTGVEADTGAIHGVAARSDLAVTFHKPKPCYREAPQITGELVVAPVGIPPEAEEFTGPGDVFLVNPPRPLDSHKGMAGVLLVVGGSHTYSGAPALASLAAYRAGVDLVYTAVPESAAQAAASFSPSIIAVKLPGRELAPQSLAALEPFLERATAVALGPGLGRSKGVEEAVAEMVALVAERRKPLVVDADALKALSGVELGGETVLTPHAGEFKALTGEAPPEGWRERGRAVEKAARELGATILLKGRVDVVSDGDRTRFNWTGNPGMTVGGTGDVLTGVTGAYLSKGFEAFQSACAAAFLNGLAGDLAAAELGHHLVAEDLLSRIPEAVRLCLEG